MSILIIVIYFLYLIFAMGVAADPKPETTTWLGLALLVHALVFGCALAATVLGAGGGG